MKVILKRFNQKVLEEILNQDRTLLIMRKVPKLTPPYEVYIYMSTLKNTWCERKYDVKVGRMVFDTKEPVTRKNWHYMSQHRIDGKVVAKFTVFSHNEFMSIEDGIQMDGVNSLSFINLGEASNITLDELHEVVPVNSIGYGIVIRDLKVLDEPLEVNEFLVRASFETGNCSVNETI